MTSDDDFRKALNKLVSDISDVLVAQAKIVGAIELLASKVEAGDKQSEQLVALLRPRLDALDREVARNEKTAADNLVTLQAEIMSHKHEDAPHDRSIGVRLGKIENSLSEMRGSMKTLAFLSPVLTGTVTGAVVFWITK